MTTAIRDDALRLEAPVMRAGAAEAGLHLVGDAHAAGGAHIFVGVLEVARRELDKAADALDGLGDEGRDLARCRVFDDLLDVLGVFAAGVGVVVAEMPAIGVGGDGVVDAEGVRRVELPGAVRGDAHAGGVATVVGVAQGDDVVVARREARHEQRDPRARGWLFGWS